MDICSAINKQHYIEFRYEGHLRKVIPSAHGNQISTHSKVIRGLQVAGTSASGKFDFPKLFEVDKVSGLRIVEERFEVPPRYKKGDKHISPIHCEL